MAIWTAIQPLEYERNKKLAAQFGFAFVGCMICAHKDGHPDSNVCQDCIENTSTEKDNELRTCTEGTTEAIRKALRTGSREDYPSDELCDVRWCAALAAAPKVEQIPQQWRYAVRMAIEATQKVIDMPRSAESIRLCTQANTALRELVKP